MPTYLGIDVGTVAVKVAVIKATYRRMQLAAIRSIDVASVAGGVPEAIRMATLQALGGKGGNDGVAVAIEGVRAAVRTITLPASAQKQIAEVLPFELEAQVPFDMGQSVFDWRVLARPKGEVAPDQGIEVLTAVARIEDVQARIDLLKTAIGQEPERVGVGAFPLANLVPHAPALAEDEAILVLDIGNKTSELVILRGGEALFVRTLSFGTEGLPATAAKLAREVRVSIAAYRAQGGQPPVRIYLCGGGAYVSGAQGFLAGELELPVEMLPPLAIDASLIEAERQVELPRFAKAIGLAMGLVGRAQGLNLRKGSLSYERGFAWVREKVPVLAGLAAVIAVSFLFSSWARLHSLSNERSALESALGTVTKDVLGEETSSASRAQELLAKQTALIDEDPMPHADAFDVMVKISEAIPQSMKHDIEELDIAKGHVTVHGIVGSIPEAQSIKSSLQDERCFKDVKISRTTSVVGGDRQKYVMEFDLKCPEDDRTPLKKGGAQPGGSASAAASSSGGK